MDGFVSREELETRGEVRGRDASRSLQQNLRSSFGHMKTFQGFMCVVRSDVGVEITTKLCSICPLKTALIAPQKKKKTACRRDDGVKLAPPAYVCLFLVGRVAVEQQQQQEEEVAAADDE